MTYQATQMVAPPELMISGMVINQFRENLTREITDPIMDKHGLTDVDSETFYPAAIMDDIYREIFSGQNGQQSLVAMGKASATITLDFVKPETPKDNLDNMHAVFTTYLRNMPEGFGIIVTEIEPTKHEVWNNTQVPNDLIYGFLWECIKASRGEGKRFMIKPLEGYNRESKVGARFEVSWDA